MSTRPATVAEVNSTVDTDGVISIDDGKIKKKIIKEGNGPTPADRSDVTVHYTGRLLDGTVFDSSRTRNDPFVFKIGKGQVIKGWDRGVATMKVGETAILTCAPEYAYGARGSPPKIPPNATLEFEVELLSFDNTQKVTEDGGVKKSIQSIGDGSPNRPNDQAVVMIKYRGRVKGNDKPFVDHWGEAVEMKLGVDPASVWGLEEGIKNMHSGEKSVLFIQPGYGYAQKGDEKLSIPPNAELEYDVELVSFTRSKDAGELDFEAKKAYMNALKELGNGVFKLGINLDRAEKLYRKCVDVFPYDGALDDDQKKAVQAIKISAMSNHALCKFKKSEWEAVVGHANAALEIDPKHVKCLYYRGVSRLRLGDAPAAQADFEAALAVDANNKDCARELNEIKRKRKAELDREKKTFGGFFNKVKLVSAEEEAQAAKEHAEAEARRKQASGEEDSDSDVEADTTEEAAPQKE